MIQIVCGEKGKGKTKEMLKHANESVADAQGSIVYIDKSPQHMYELSNRIRLINISEYPVDTYEGFIGFISGLLSGNHDIECVFIDSFIKIAHLKPDNITKAIETLDNLSSNGKFVCSLSVSEDTLEDNIKDKVLVSC